jgi:nitrile hydratase
MSDDHDHDDHDHGHHPAPLTDVEKRVAAIESLLVERGLVTTDTIDAIVEVYEHDLGPMNGATVVAHAWTDEAYRARLLEDATAAIAELGFGGAEGEHIVALENTPTVHNVVVCTLCSCYPWAMLGLPPRWYKDPAYRSRIVREPRRVLAEFGVQLEPEVEVRVWDSSAEVRYLVLPQAPANAAQLAEDELVARVTRDAMIGVAR